MHIRINRISNIYLHFCSVGAFHLWVKKSTRALLVAIFDSLKTIVSSVPTQTNVGTASRQLLRCFQNDDSPQNHIKKCRQGSSKKNASPCLHKERPKITRYHAGSRQHSYHVRTSYSASVHKRLLSIAQAFRSGKTPCSVSTHHFAHIAHETLVRSLQCPVLVSLV